MTRRSASPTPAPPTRASSSTARFALPQTLQARGRNAANTATTYANVGSSATPTSLLTYTGPASNDVVTVGFSQLVNSTDALRTGAYSKTLTFTLSTTTP